MEKQYIKFIEGDTASLNEAIKLAEDNWYVKESGENALDFEWTWILDCDENWTYYTSYCIKQELIDNWYTELKKETIQWVYVSDASEEDALQQKAKRILLSTLPWKVFNKYICVDETSTQKYLNWKEYYWTSWKYTVPVKEEEKKERKVMMTDSEWEEFSKKNSLT